VTPDNLPTKRPQPWRGPDDSREWISPEFAATQREALIAAWDKAKGERLRSMSLWQRIVYAFFYSSDTMP
jgi:hypothetical protein